MAAKKKRPYRDPEIVAAERIIDALQKLQLGWNSDVREPGPDSVYSSDNIKRRKRVLRYVFDRMGMTFEYIRDEASAQGYFSPRP
jgi:hypothetical protein